MENAAKKEQPGADAEAIEKMNQPIDVNADYRISGQTIAQLYTLIDEIPMKYARSILPCVATNIDKLPTKD